MLILAWIIHRKSGNVRLKFLKDSAILNKDDHNKKADTKAELEKII